MRVPLFISTWNPGQMVCDLRMAPWILDEELARKLVAGAMRLEFGIEIYSGYRSPQEQEDLIKAGRPAAPVGVSNHTTCPSRAADVRPLIAVTDVVKARLGEVMVSSGLRWGGGAPVDQNGIPIKGEWRHFDLGKRPT